MSNAGTILGSDDYSSSTYRCEVLVVGSGAGGSVAAAVLAEAGRDVILLEEGGFHPPDAADPTNISHTMSILYRNRAIFPFMGVPTIPFAEGRCVGGGTVVNGALVRRTPDWILDEWSNGLGLAELSSSSLDEHFETVERDLGVARSVVESDSNLDSLYLLRGAQQLGWLTEMAPRAVSHCKNINLCPVGCLECGKQSTLENYIPRAMASGSRTFTNCRAVKIVHSNGVAKSIHANVIGSTIRTAIEISFDDLVLAGGAIQTPHLLRRSKLSGGAGRNLQFHMNLKIVAVFGDRIRADRGTMFTAQVREFARDGLLIMASNLLPHYVVTTAAHHGTDAVNHILNNYESSAIYTAMIRARSTAHVVSRVGDTPLVWYRFDPLDLIQVKVGLHRAAQVLFEAGAIELYMPMSGLGAVGSLEELDRGLETLKPTKLEIVTVHAMASCPMGPNPESSVVRPDGRLWNAKNVILADASILPTNIGESPQGTIMALAHAVVQQHA